MFNVCDKEGRHLGFIWGKSLLVHGWQVALSSARIDNDDINWELVKSQLADQLDSRNFWGKVKESTLIAKLKEVWDQKYARDLDIKFLPTSDLDYLKFMYLVNGSNDMGKSINLDRMDIRGYIFMDSTDPQFFNQDNLLLDSDLNFITERAIDRPPVFGEISSIPKIYLSVMGFTEGFLLGANWSDYGGRNHTHSTIVDIRLGSVDTRLRFPIQIPFKKGEPVQIYFSESGEISSVYYDGAIYVLNTEPEESTPAYSFDSSTD